MDFKQLVLDKYDLSCVQLFSYDVILPYLLKEKNCTKYNFLFVVSSEKVQNKMIQELNKKSPKFIFMNQKYDFIRLRSIDERFKKIASYIDINYELNTQVKNWSIYKRK